MKINQLLKFIIEITFTFNNNKRFHLKSVASLQNFITFFDEE